MSIETMTKQKEISFITLGDYAKGVLLKLALIN